MFFGDSPQGKWEVKLSGLRNSFRWLSASLRIIRIMIVIAVNSSIIERMFSVVKALNATFNPAIGCPPVAVTEKNQIDVFHHLYGQNDIYNPDITPRLAVGSKVRILLDRNVFSRGFEPYFSDEIYEVTSHTFTIPEQYTLVSPNDGYTLNRKYYFNELMKFE